MALDFENKFFFSEVVVPVDRVLLCSDVIKEQASWQEYEESTAGAYRKIVAARDFHPGQVVYFNESILISHDWSIITKVGEERIWLDNLQHTINKGDGLREYYGFDTFQNHSCDPNTYMRFKAETLLYDVIATKEIRAGDEITIDYELIDPGLDGTSFQCGCAVPGCRGVISA